MAAPEAFCLRGVDGRVVAEYDLTVTESPFGQGPIPTGLLLIPKRYRRFGGKLVGEGADAHYFFPYGEET